MDNLENNILISTIKIKEYTFNGEIFYFEKINTTKLLLKEIIYHNRKNTFEKLKNKYYNQDAIQLYFAHYFNMHTNYFANTLFPRAKINIIPDGILSFYPYKLSYKNKLKQFIFKGISYLVGLRYKTLFENIVDPFARISFIYTYEPKLTYRYSKVTGIIKIKTRNKPNLDVQNTALLILGTTYNMDIITIKIIEFINNNRIKKIYYKKHPSVKKDNSYLQLVSILGNEIKLINNDISAEECIEVYKMGNIISIGFSTALIEIQRQYSNKLNCYASLYKNSNYFAHFKSVMTFYNIKNI